MTIPPTRTVHVLNSTMRRGAELYGSQLGEALASTGASHEIVALRASVSSPALDVPVLSQSSVSIIGAARALRGRTEDADVIIAHGGHTLMAANAAVIGRPTQLIYRLIGDPDYWSPTGARRRRVAWMLGRCTTSSPSTTRLVSPCC